QRHGPGPRRPGTPAPEPGRGSNPDQWRHCGTGRRRVPALRRTAVSSRRAPAPPPTLPGYRFLSVLGSGGFSDVYLYEQDRPRRKVAVKVLTADLKTEGARASLESEAN